MIHPFFRPFSFLEMHFTNYTFEEGEMFHRREENMKKNEQKP